MWIPPPVACASPSMPVIREVLIRGNREALVLEAARPSNAQLPSASSLCSSLQFLLSDANMVGLRYGEARQRELMDTKVDLARVREQHHKMMEENEVIIKQNEDLTECLAIVETKVEGLEHTVVAKRESKKALQAKLDRLIEEYVLEDFKKKIAKNGLNSMSKLKINILFHAQGIGGPFDVRKMDLNAPEETNSPAFYLKDDSTEYHTLAPSTGNATSFVVNGDMARTAGNDDVVQKAERETDVL
ncbi:hypothetical protein GOBAR_AA11753 [Gossypium barbadense]|uniref:Uncharacterized protein n=1 Tax=Gossypium barbadense TaxID=3634 RepID=A0A2P5Y028_GOSBA|nr:hypothetical protein GOBAR_AA11753 [Gossypium barbadense]